jgi:hypothetical protein
VESVSGNDPLDMKERTTDYDAYTRILIERMPRSQRPRRLRGSPSPAHLCSEAFARGEKSRTVEYMVRHAGRSKTRSG